MKKKTSPKSKKMKAPEHITYSRDADCFAALEGNAPSMEELVRRAKEGDKGKSEKSFLALIKFNTTTYLANFDESSKDLSLSEIGKVDIAEEFFRHGPFYPAIDVNKEFFRQGWVKERIKAGMSGLGNRGRLFRKRFWETVFSHTQTDHLKWAGQEAINAHIASKKVKENKFELKRYIILRKDKLNKELKANKIHFDDILKECENMRIVGDRDYEDLDSFKKYLNCYGIIGKPGRPKKAK